MSQSSQITWMEVRAARPKGPKGFTLVELLVALVIGSLILMAMFGVYATAKKTYEVQMQLAEMQQYYRVARDLLARELRMSGFGRPAWPIWNSDTSDFDITYTLEISQGAGGDPDVINAVGCFDAPDGTVASAAAAGSTTITLGSGEGGNFNTTTKSEVYLPGLANVRVTGVSTDTLTVDSDPSTAGNQGLPVTIPGGTSAYRVKRHTYEVDGTVLRRDENTGAGAQVIAENVEDLQATYTAPLLSITLRVRTDRENADYTHPVYGDGFRRLSQTMDLKVRNL